MKYRALTPKEVGRFALGASLGSYLMAVIEFLNPSVPDASGRSGWLVSFFYREFGPRGKCAFWVALGTFLLITYFQHRKKQSEG